MRRWVHAGGMWRRRRLSGVGCGLPWCGRGVWVTMLLLLSASAEAAGVRALFDGEVTARTFSIGDMTKERSLNSLTGLLRLHYYPTLVVDDDAAPQLQPFLQRRSELTLGASVGYEVFEPWIPTRSTIGGGGEVGGDLYVTPLVAIWFRLAADRGTWSSRRLATPGTFSDIELAAGAALRLDDVRFGVGYQYWGTWSDFGTSEYASPGWGRLLLDAKAVLRRSIALSVRGCIWDGKVFSAGTSTGVGGSVDAGVEWYPTRDSGLTFDVGGSGGAATLTQYGLVAEDAMWMPGYPLRSVHWALGLSHYFGPRLGVGLRYLGHYEWYDAAGLAPAALSSGLRINLSARF